MGLGNTGVPGANLPAMLDEAHVMRRLADIERYLRELTAIVNILPPGSVGNDLLKNPVAPGAVYGSATNYALTTTMTTVATSTITVPEGFTSAVVTMTGRAYAINPGAADSLYSRVAIDGAYGNAIPMAIGAGGSGSNVSLLTRSLAGLTPGATFDITLEAKTAGAGWAANASNTAELSGSILWFK